jgi:hypothetical protein
MEYEGEKSPNDFIEEQRQQRSFPSSYNFKSCFEHGKWAEVPVPRNTIALWRYGV